MNLQVLSMCIVPGLLLAVVASDLRSRRIPNAIVLYGMALGLIFRFLAPADAALLPGTAPGLAAGMWGGLAGLAAFLPLYVLRVMGAGDVKLVAMLGVWLGTEGVLHTVLWSLVAGGVLALAVALAGGLLRQVGHNVLRIVGAAVMRTASAGMLAQAPTRTTGRLPYAVAIAAGTLVEMARHLSV